MPPKALELLKFSVFNDRSIKNAVFGKTEAGNQYVTDPQGYAVITLMPSKGTNNRHDPKVVGVIQNEIGYTINAEWTALGGAGGIIPQIAGLGGLGSTVDNFVGEINKPINALGYGNVGTAFTSRKVYRQSGYLTINPEIMVVDWSGKAEPLKAAVVLASLCIPSGDGVEDLIKYLTDKFPDKAKLVKNALDKLQEGVVNVKKTAGGGSSNDTTGPTSNKSESQQSNKNSAAGRAINFGGDVFEDVSDYLSLRKSPNPVEVRIGNYFYHKDMVLESVQISFSKEMTTKGPLYAKFNLSLSSRKIINGIDQIGISSPDKGTRVILPEVV